MKTLVAKIVPITSFGDLLSAANQEKKSVASVVPIK